jgi:arylsulfatase A-like enzyme
MRELTGHAAIFHQCAPSRASFLFGRSPFVTQVLNNNNLGTRQAPAAAGWACTRLLQPHARQTDPLVFVCLPAPIPAVFQLFRNQGYVTYAGGKVFHADDPPSFTNVYNPNNVGETGDDCLGDSKAHFFPHVPAFAVCRTAMPINTLPDFVTANRAVQQLRAHVAANASAKFFLAAGFLKPHTPLHVQTQFFNLFGTGLPFNGVRELGSAVIRPVSSMSEYYFDRWSEIRGSKGTMQFTPYDPTTIQFRITARAGYLAALAQTDAACGLVLNELGALGLTDTTMVIVTSDHGYVRLVACLLARHRD